MSKFDIYPIFTDAVSSEFLLDGKIAKTDKNSNTSLSF